MNKKIFTLLLALTVLLGGMVNAQDKASKQSTNQATNKVDLSEVQMINGKVVEYATSPTIKHQLDLGQKAVIFNEGFEGTFPPTDWAVVQGPLAAGSTQGNWIQNTGTRYPSGYAAFEGTKLVYFNSFSCQTGNTADLITHTFDASAAGTTLKFAMFRDDGYATNNENIQVRMSTDGGTTWTNLGAALPRYSALGDYWEEVIIPLTGGTATTKLSFFATSAYGNDVHIDDIQVYIPEEHDLGVIAATPTLVESGATVTPTVTVKNFGINEEATYTVTITDGGSYTSTVVVNTAIAPNTTAVIDMAAWTPADGTYTLTATVSATGDTYAANNTMDITCQVYEIVWAYAIVSGNQPYKFDLLNPATFVNLGSPILASAFVRSGAWANGQWYIAINTTNNLMTVDTETGVATVIGPMTEAPNGMSYDYTTGNMYAVNATNLYTVDLATGALTLVGSMGITESLFINLACDINGNLFAVNIQDDSFYSINKTTGAATLIGATGIAANYGQDMEFDNNTGILYWASCGPSNTLYTVDVTTGAVTEVGVLPNQTSGMAIPFTPEGAYANFTVTDGTNPIAGAVVTVNGNNYTANNDGEVSVYLQVGEYPYSVAAFGYEPYTSTSNIVIVDGVDVNIPVTLVALNDFDVTFNIEDELGADLNAVVTVYYGTNVYETATAVNGTLTMTDVPVGTYTFDVTLDGYVAQTALPLEITNANVTKDIVLVEVRNEPYALMVNVLNNTAEFSWNNATGFDDDFESYEDFTLTPGDWTLVDVDGLATYGFSGITFPNSGVAMAGIIMNPELTTPALTGSPAHSGTKYLAVFNPASGAACNDWVISPKTVVPPNGQVTFWARGGNANYSEEKFQVHVSTTDATPASFTSISSVVTCAAGSVEWVQYTYSLSAYAGQEVYVGLRITSVDQFYFCLDDFSIGMADKAFEGYNVYLDNMTTPVTTVTGTSYTFTNLAVGAHTAGVCAVYSTGVSNIATMSFNIVNINGVNKMVAIYPNPSNGIYTISMEGVNQVQVTDITGRVVLSKEIRNNGQIDLSAQPNGVYFVKAGNSNFKVVKQ